MGIPDHPNTKVEYPTMIPDHVLIPGHHLMIPDHHIMIPDRHKILDLHMHQEKQDCQDLTHTQILFPQLHHISRLMMTCSSTSLMKSSSLSSPTSRLWSRWS